METTYNVIGIGFDDLENHEDHFEEVCDYCEGAFYESKTTFKHEEEDFDFDYKFCIECLVCEGKAYYSLILVPLTLCEESKQKVINCCGGEDEDYELHAFDIASYGFQVHLGTESENIEDEDEYEWNEDILNKLSSVYKFINALLGFYLDKPLNLIGTTGWDILNDAISGKCAFDAAISRN